MAEQATAEQVVSTPSIYRHLAAHQTTADGWALRDLFEKLHQWAGVFITEFKLELAEYAVGVDPLPLRVLGCFRCGYDGHGLKASITLNVHYVVGPLARPFWDTLGTLLHELLHAWQEVHGKRGRGNYHNKEFRDRALECGLLIDEYGHQEYLPGGRLLKLLKERGVVVPTIDPPKPAPRRAGRSKLKKWSCRCTNIRVASKDFSATCNNCDCPFEIST
jgi:hypothetical protein